MKIRVYILFILLYSCSSKVQEPKYLLTIADLKFPLTDEYYFDNLFPTPLKQIRIKNQVRMEVAEEELKNTDSIPTWVRIHFKEETRHTKIKFEDWYRNLYSKMYGGSDTNFYDKKGNLIRSASSGLWRFYERNKYDTLGFRINSGGGNCVFFHALYGFIFDSRNRILYWVEYEENRMNGIYMPQVLESLSFDSAGYLLQSISYFIDGSISRTIFSYNNDKKITQFRKNNFWKKGSDAGKEIATYDQSIAKYFYHDQRLDSIITYHESFKDTSLNYFVKSYFDSTGLLSKAINCNPSYPHPKITDYSYSKY